MANTKISALTALAARPANNDLLNVVDVSDTTMGASGTNKKVTYAEMMAAPVVTYATLPSAASSTGLVYRVSNAGGSLFYSDGSVWKPVGGMCVIAQSFVQATVTGTITETALATITIPGNIMGLNGMLELHALWSMTSSANNKRIRHRYSGAAGTQYYDNTLTTGALGSPVLTRIANRNSASSQVGHAAANLGFLSSGNALVTSAVDTTADTTLVLTGTLTNTGETIGLEGYSVRLFMP